MLFVVSIAVGHVGSYADSKALYVPRYSNIFYCYPAVPVSTSPIDGHAYMSQQTQ